MKKSKKFSGDAPTSPQISDAELRLFSQDLKSFVGMELKKIPSLYENRLLPDARNSLQNALLNLGAAAYIVQLDLAGKLIESLVHKMSDIDPAHSLTDQEISILTKGFDFLRDWAMVEPELLFSHIEKQSSFIKEYLQINEKQFATVPKVKEFQPVISDPSLLSLFRNELESQVHHLTQGLLALEQNPQDKSALESLLRAVHSIKGAARVVEFEDIVDLSHALEDCFSAAESEKLLLSETHLNFFFEISDFLETLYLLKESSLLSFLRENKDVINEFKNKLGEFCLKKTKVIQDKFDSKKQPSAIVSRKHQSPQSDRFLRVSADNLSRLMGLAAESIGESLWLQPFGDSLLAIKKELNDEAKALDLLRESLAKAELDLKVKEPLNLVEHKFNESRQLLSARISEFDMFIRGHESLSERLYREVIDIRMRPFADCVKGFPRFIRDLSQQLKKKIKFEITGLSTSVDRDILEKMEAPLIHLLRNAVDHGIESPQEREALGKSAEGHIKLEARHLAGSLVITVEDDGRGVDLKKIRQTIINRNLAKPDFVNNLKDTELIDFLFLLGFSTTENITEISGRGIGLNIVQEFLQEVGGTVHTSAKENKGMCFTMQLPLTLSVIRSLQVEIGGEAYAFPLARIEQALLIKSEQIHIAENQQYFTYLNKNVGLVPAFKIFNVSNKIVNEKEFSVVLISDRHHYYGVIVDKFIEGKELVVQKLDPNLGKIPNVSSGAFMDNGLPLLIIDVDDMIRSIDKILSGEGLKFFNYLETQDTPRNNKRILVIDDSITVREVESRLLQNQGYAVDMAINGMDGWNAIRIGKYDLIITDIDMPRMNGIELIKLVKQDPRFQELPIMVVSYKEREEDRRLGLEAGANYYLTKSSFHDETLVDAVIDLIGKP